ncbi:hypothetical protein P1X14_15875 [Sphingomonas sp. AOB5]|uniref:hypothetical protein n=1 Tax=Sphingomonas sp. AOB5 TaxID=3034017 RepID=UPI0023F630C3|nr:hypothetical protein [Sphingomonas sp. AOB5]MDF7776736.1 hypothetical protein [Sphingomonas sp. AOB5]
MLLAALLLLAQDAPCTATDANLPAPLAGWIAPGASFAVGKPVVMKAVDASAIPGLPAGSKPGGAAMIGFRVETAGSYGIALDQGGWIDVIPGAVGGEPLKSVKHGHGPACSTIRKIVRFDLQPGMYRLTLTGLTKPEVRVMLVAPE